MTHSIDLEALRAMQKDAGLKNLPTAFTYEMRRAIAGQGPHAYNWSDKPHRLVYDLCAELERISASPAPVAGSVDDLSARNRELEEASETKDAEIIRLSRELGLAFNREEDYVNQIEDYKRRSGGLVRG